MLVLGYLDRSAHAADEQASLAEAGTVAATLVAAVHRIQAAPGV